MHGLVADATKNPELVIGKTEADALETAFANVARHYGIAASQKAIDHAALFMVIGGIYGPKLAFITMRKKQERKDAAQPAVRHPFGVVHGTIPPGA